MLFLPVQHRKQGLFKTIRERHPVPFLVLGLPVVGYDRFLCVFAFGERARDDNGDEQLATVRLIHSPVVRPPAAN